MGGKIEQDCEEGEEEGESLIAEDGENTRGIYVKRSSKARRFTSLSCSSSSNKILLLIILLLISMMLNLYYFVYRPMIDVPPASSVVHNNTTGCGDNVHREDAVAVVYGLVHLAKTAGTEINGELASHFERVCGNKGWSYDAYQFNKRVKEENSGRARINVRSSSKDSVSQIYKKGNRGKVPNAFMDEIGFEDCDYISQEMSWQNWASYVPWQNWTSFKEMPSLELHVPCRDPLAHLMSQCNYRHIRFNCSTDDLPLEINNCLVEPGRRFSRDLEKLNNTNMKCFNPIPIEPYLEYMSGRLQRKRIENTYVHRDTNKKRKKNDECIWKKRDVKKKVQEIMLKEHDVYGWCNECMGSKDDLLANAQ
jgi:hypothetical protein